MTYDLFRIIEIKTDGYAGVAYRLENLIKKFQNSAKPGEIYKVWGLGSTRQTENDDSGNYEIINGVFVKTNKKPMSKWVPVHFYTDHDIFSSLIYSGKEMESNPSDFMIDGHQYNKIPYIVTESGRFLKDLIMEDSVISRRGIPEDCNEEYRHILSDEDRTDADMFFDRKCYVTYATLETLEREIARLENEWKSEALEKILKDKNDTINDKLDIIISLINKETIRTKENKKKDEDIDYWDEEVEDILFNHKYWLIQDLYKEVEGISMFVNSATANYTSYSNIRVCYWVEN